MSKRHSMGRRRSERHFTNGALRVHPRNAIGSQGGPMRGGIRL